VGGGRLQGNAQQAPGIGAPRDQSVTLCDTPFPSPRTVHSKMVITSNSLRMRWHYSDFIQAGQSQSIQTLLEAEKEAQKVVQQARQCMISPPFVIYSPRALICPRRSHTKAEGCSLGGNQGD